MARATKFDDQLGVAGNYCLDFANTVVGRAGSGLHDRLGSYRDILRWAEVTGILDTPIVSRLEAKALQDDRGAARIHEMARTFRDAVHEVFSSIVAGSRAPSDSLSILNRQTFRLIGQTKFSLSSGHVERFWAGADDALDRVLWPVAWSVFDLLSGSEVERVRECENTDCHWLFVDRSRNRSRRWCDMRQCGNIIKARRHYRRHGRRPQQSK